MRAGDEGASLSSIALEENEASTETSRSTLVSEQQISAVTRFVGGQVGMGDDGRKIDEDGNEVYDLRKASLSRRRLSCSSHDSSHRERVTHSQALGKSEVMNRARAVRSRGSYHKIEPGDDDPKVRREASQSLGPAS